MPTVQRSKGLIGTGGAWAESRAAELAQRAPPDREPARAIHPRNQILYGPPGTGKTWNTLNLALAILDGVEQSPDRDEERFSQPPIRSL